MRRPADGHAARGGFGFGTARRGGAGGGGAGLDKPRREALETPRREPSNPPPRWTGQTPGIRPGLRLATRPRNQGRLGLEPANHSKSSSLSRAGELMMAISGNCCYVAGRLLAFTCFTGARRPIVHICGSSRPVFVDVSLGPTLLDVSLGPTLWSQLRRPRQLFVDTSRANYLEPGPTPPPAPTSRRQVASQLFGANSAARAAYVEPRPACYGSPSERDSLAAPEARRRCCGPVGPRTTNWGALCLCARHGGPFSKSSRSYPFLQKRSKIENAIPNMCFGKFHLF